MMIPLRLDPPLEPGETLLDRLFRLDAEKKGEKRSGEGSEEAPNAFSLD